MTTKDLETTGPNRLRVRYSLRTLLLLVSVLGAALAHLGTVWRHAQHQRSIVKQIQRADGRVRFNFQFAHGEDLIWEAWRYPIVTSRYRVPQVRQIRHLEQPPGPKLVRMILGDDAYASVESIEFWASNPKYLSSFDLRLMRRLPRLRVIQIADVQICDETLRIISDLPEIRMVRLFGVPSATATPDGLRELRRCEPLESLLLCGEWVQDEHVAAVGELGKLKCLTLLGTPNVTSGVFESAGKLRSLRELYIVDADLVVDEGATHLQYLHELKVLLLAETSISDLTVENLKQLKKLEWLSLAGTQVGDAAMLVLAELPQLQTLDLERTKVGDEGLARLSSHKELRVLSLSETRVTNEGLRAIGLMTQLETLDLWLTSIDDQGLEHLVSLSNLRHLQLGPDISKEAEDRLRRRLPNCTIEVFYTP